MPDISRSVGRGGANDDDDVIIVQRLLNGVSAMKGGANPILDIDGWGGQKTINAIARFQAIQLNGFSDGLIEPGRKTINFLNSRAEDADARPVPDPDLDPATQARQDAPQASSWGMAGLAAITGLSSHFQLTGGISGFDDVVETALAGHFHIDASTPVADIQPFLITIRRNYTAALMEISGGLHYHSVTRHEMFNDFARAKIKKAPGYTPFTAPRRICWSPLFHASRNSKAGYDWAGRGFGPLCRAAMVLHEPIHFVDPQADFDTYEWGPDYTALTARRAVHNASSYPSFGAHIFEHSALPLGPRYGAGRPNE
jgi:hypothetical protein